MMGGRRAPSICEVSPRDGLQNEAVTLSVVDRVALVDRLSATGVQRIEAASFVNRRAVPQMAGAAEVFAGIARKSGVEYSALALNRRGGADAIAAGADRVNFAIAASDRFNQRNQRSTVDGSLAEFAGVVADCKAAGVPVTATIAVAFGCPFEGEMPVGAVVRLGQALVASGASELFVADTIGVGVPAQVEALAAGLRTVAGDTPLGVHLHDTRGTGLANADAAMRLGFAWIDSAVGGFGGCPFAPGASGNVATEDVVWLMRQSSMGTGLDIESLKAAAAWLAEKLGKRAGGAISRVGAFPETAAGRDALISVAAASA